jgi:hypothetical protein
MMTEKLAAAGIPPADDRIVKMERLDQNEKTSKM